MAKITPEITRKAFKEHVKSIISNPFTAIIELIANAYDAGATELNISWPLENTLDDTQESSTAIFKDNGEGISREDFPEIWKELSYNRITNQGTTVTFNYEGEEITRDVYGKNGKGRHAPFAFSNKYTVKTIKNNELSIFKIETDIKGFSIEEIEVEKTEEESGTEISFDIDSEKNIEIEALRESIATRFLKDDTFKIILNNETIDLTDIEDENKTEIMCTVDDSEIKIIQLQSTTKSSYIKFHGLSWKIGNRLIEDKTWDNILDGRKKISKRFNFIIDAEILKDYTNDNMTGFIKDDYVNTIKNGVIECIKKSINKTLKHEYDKTKKDIIIDELPEIKKLSPLNQDELGQFISDVQENCPGINYNHLKSVTEIFIKLKKTSTGYDLLKQLSELSSKDYDELSEILNEWDIHSAKIVLDEIKWRLDFINELKIKMDDPLTDEVHELQPLFNKGLWIFGPEFESIEYTSNKSLSNVIRNLFNKKKINVENPLSRPDFVVIPSENKSISLYSAPSFDEENETEDIGKLLIIELKKGGFEITSKEIHQAEWYIEQLIDGGYISENAQIQAYVLGSKVKAKKRTIGDNNNIKIIPKQYHIILNKAENRLFKLDQKIRENKNIKNKTDDDIIDDVLKQDIIM